MTDIVIDSKTIDKTIKLSDLFLHPGMQDRKQTAQKWRAQAMITRTGNVSLPLPYHHQISYVSSVSYGLAANMANMADMTASMRSINTPSARYNPRAPEKRNPMKASSRQTGCSGYSTLQFSSE
mmetsp:Transcript_4175/g.6644  ORF Transcript_4175/g.6644 Transcript_4175/m.6644 type:complete len:124 (-) Transcript_4175:258-629(-)